MGMIGQPAVADLPSNRQDKLTVSGMFRLKKEQDFELAPGHLDGPYSFLLNIVKVTNVLRNTVKPRKSSVSMA